MSESIIVKKAYSFALEIVKAYKQLISEKKEYVLSKQLVRCGTSIGANVNEAVSSQSKKEFVYKLGISLKEARETQFWLNVLNDSGYLDNNMFLDLNNECGQIIKILNS